MGRLRNGCVFLGLISSVLGTIVSDQRHPKGEPSGAGPCLSPVDLKSFVVYMLQKRSSICALKTFRSRPPTDRARMSVRPNERIPDQTTHRSRLADGGSGSEGQRYSGKQSFIPLIELGCRCSPTRGFRTRPPTDLRTPPSAEHLGLSAHPCSQTIRFRPKRRTTGCRLLSAAMDLKSRIIYL